MPLPKRIAIYSCVTGGYDRLSPPVDPVPGVDHILFTDQPDIDKATGWDIRPITPPEGLSPTLRSRYHKVLPHRFLTDYDASMFIDGNVAITASLKPFFETVFRGPENIAIHDHPSRTTVREEADACLAIGRVKNPDALRQEVKRYFDDGFPDTQGMVGSAIVVRRHNEPEVIDAMEMWWDLLSKGSGRDQVSFPYMLWKLNPPVHVIKPHFSISSPYFMRYPHWGTAGSRARAYIWAIQNRQRSLPHRLAYDALAASYGSKRSF